MREIKFRAWDCDNLCMYYSDREEDNGEGIILWVLHSSGVHFEELRVIDTNPGGMGHEQDLNYYKPNQTLMQFTGLLDKNGKEIYEGDIFRNKFGEGVIVWNQVACAFQMDWTKTDLDSDKTWFPTGIKTLEVIGNIHEPTTPNT